jgi:DNA-binding IclR family transcriptional regulator
MATDTVKSAARAFEIVDAFRSERRRLTAAQMGGLLDYPRSSLNVLMKSLVAQGYLSFDAHEQSYFPTLKVTHLGDWVPGALFNSGSVQPLLQELRNSTRETVTLTMATGFHMRCLVAIMGTHQIGLQLDEGTLFPMFGSGVGTAYLSTLADDVIAGLHRRAKSTMPRGRLLDLAIIMDDVAATRADGICRIYNAVVPDAGAVAMPVSVAEYGETLVIAVAGLSHRIKDHEATISKALTKCVSAISRIELGS